MLLILITIGFAIYFFCERSEPLRRWLATPDGKATYADWVGNKSIFDLLTGMSATAAAIAAVFLALRSYRINQRVALANRYQKGVELLGANVDSSKIGGIELLSMVSREAYKEFQEPVIRTLRQFLQERCFSFVNEVYNSEDPHKPANPSDLVITATISAIVRTNWRKRWLDLESDDQGLNLTGIYLHQTQLTGYDFSRINFKYSLLGFVVFKDCKFTHTIIDARCFGKLVFDNCIFENSKINIRDLKSKFRMLRGFDNI